MFRSILLVFMIFPFTQIIPLSTYNQPYSLLTALLVLMVWPSAYGRMPQVDRFFLGYLFLVGMALFLISLLTEISIRQIQYLLVYVSPAIIVPAAVNVMCSNPQRARNILTWGILIWTGVGLVQLLAVPDFLVFLASRSDSLAQNILASGRGQLGLAPEPTHHGLHMLCLAAALMFLRGPVWVVGLAIGSALLIAMSSFTALTLAVGCVIWALLRPWRWPYLLVAVLVPGLFLAFGSLIFDPDTRIGVLLELLRDNGFAALLVIDPSSNMRLYGIAAPVIEAARSVFFPLGMEHTAWMEMSSRILIRNPNIVDLSGSGPASGYGLIVVQAGLFGIPFVFYAFQRLCLPDAATWRGLTATAGFSVFIGQIYLSTPSFSLILASAITAILLRRAAARVSSPG